MPGEIYWAGFQFSGLRTEGAFGTDIPGEHTGTDGADVPNYPYLSCEIGGGMMSSYHRRILVNPLDSVSTTLVKLGSGGASTGYYMYHGGENPEGKLSTLMESQATGMWNDMPVKNYDFQTALGQYGQIRPQYHLLRRLHLFLHEWGASLAEMAATMPEQRPHGRNDVDTLRWSVRSDGQRGFVFVNNYQRLNDMGAKDHTQFTIKLPTHLLTFPDTPVSVPANECFFWPFNLNLGPGINLDWATAQPITAVEDGKMRTIFFAATKGVPPRFAFKKNTMKVRVVAGRTAEHQAQIVVQARPGTGVALELTSKEGQTAQVVVLDETDSLALWKDAWQGRERVFLTRAGLVLDGQELRLSSTNLGDLSVEIYPAPALVESAGHRLDRTCDGVFARFTPMAPEPVECKPTFERLRPAGPPRDIPIGKIDQPVATAPLDADFDKAAVWRIHLPGNIDLSLDPILRLHYAGDVARVTLNSKLLTDDFYNGNVFEVGLRRYAPAILDGDLEVAILPLSEDAPIYLAAAARPDFGGEPSVAKMERVELVPRYQVRINSR
jgi:beta-galactosidase